MFKTNEEYSSEQGHRIIILGVNENFCKICIIHRSGNAETRIIEKEKLKNLTYETFKQFTISNQLGVKGSKVGLASKTRKIHE